MQIRLMQSETTLRDPFLKWQCRVRQMAMRDKGGRPDDGIMPAVVLQEAREPLGNIITVLNKAPAYSLTAELTHMSAKTNDPAQRREQAIQFLSASYYQKAEQFSDVLTATFAPDSDGARLIFAAGTVRLLFDAFAQRYDLHCRVLNLPPHDPLYLATMAHNRLFNPSLPPDTIVLGFAPDWQRSTSSSC